MTSVTRIALFTALLAPIAMAVAGPSVDVTITGSIMPGGCTPTLSNAQLDHGRLYSRDLRTTAPTVLDDRTRTTTLTISCEAATAYGLRAVDNRVESVLENADATRFGLGLTSKDEKIGSFRLRIAPEGSTMDGKPVLLTVGSATGKVWSAAERRTRSLRNDGQLVGLVDKEGVESGPTATKDAVLTLVSYLTIAPTANLTLDGEVPLAGAATLELFYL